MRELEREPPAKPTSIEPEAPGRLAILGAGRAGSSMAVAGRNAGLEVSVLDREARTTPRGGATVLLCVPDDAIAEACEELVPILAPGTPVGHVSGATGLDALGAALDAGCPVFSLHPLQTIPGPDTDLTGAPCAVAASDAPTLGATEALATRLGMRPFEVPEAGRAVYHAAASMASNFLIALEESASELLEAAGVPEAREVLAPLVLRTAANWADSGPAALTGPIARGDEATVSAHLEALAAQAPHLTELYEALAERTRAIGSERTP